MLKISHLRKVNYLLVIIFLLMANNLFAIDSSKAIDSGIKGVCNGDPVSYIIRNHPNLLTHKRDQTLRQGIITPTKYSLQGCIDCHANGDNNTYHAVNKSGQFCADCHEKTATSIDCFECHRTTPYQPQGGR